MSEETRAFYDTVAATYAEVLPDLRAEAPLDLGMLEHFVSTLPESEHPVLDAGCGTGRMLTFLTERAVAPLVGADLSPETLDHARAAHPDVELHVADLAALPFPDASFRGILCWYAIIHSTPAEVEEIVRESARVLQPGGTVLLGFQAGIGERVIERAYGHDVTLRGVLHETSTVATLLDDAGFDILAVADRAPSDRERSHQGFVLARRIRSL